MHEIKYLPIALKDLRDITDYITHILGSPQAAMDLLNTLDNAISRLAQFPYSCRLYQPEPRLEGEYRILPVNNYLVFYLVNEQEVEIRRVIYAKMDIAKIIR